MKVEDKSPSKTTFGDLQYGDVFKFDGGIYMKAIVYGKDNCPHCDNALTRLGLVGAEVEYIKVGGDITVQELRDRLSKEFGIGEVKTVPQIIIDGEYIGGDRELKMWLYKKAYTPNKEGMSERAFDLKYVGVSKAEEVEEVFMEEVGDK